MGATVPTASDRAPLRRSDRRAVVEAMTPREIQQVLLQARSMVAGRETLGQRCAEAYQPRRDHQAHAASFYRGELLQALELLEVATELVEVLDRHARNCREGSR